jgi:muramoyltetrapeptide carboxypeptidase
MTPSDARTRPGPAAPAAVQRSAAQRAAALRPPALRPGDQVAVLSVSSPADPAQLAIGLDALRFAGRDPVLYPSAHDQGSMRSYLAGDDPMRTCDLRAALTDPDIAGIIFAAGGSGAQRTWRAWTGPAWPACRRRCWPVTPT